MNISKEELRESILNLSGFMGLQMTYHALLTEIGLTIPEVVKNLVYDMFVRQAMICDNQSPEYLKAYNDLVAYVSELHENGFVKFIK
jgi:hypothetical protein